MGIKNPPPNPNDSTGPNACFDSGYSPEEVYLTFSGIKKGAQWTAAEGEPANGTFKCELVASGRWEYDQGGITCYCVSREFWSDCGLVNANGYINFWNDSFPHCGARWENAFTSSNSSFYGGEAWMTTWNPEDNAVSLSEMLTLSGDRKGMKNFVEPLPGTSEYSIARGTRNADGTKFKVRKER